MSPKAFFPEHFKSRNQGIHLQKQLWYRAFKSKICFKYEAFSSVKKDNYIVNICGCVASFIPPPLPPNRSLVFLASEATYGGLSFESRLKKIIPLIFVHNPLSIYKMQYFCQNHMIHLSLQLKCV